MFKWLKSLFVRRRVTIDSLVKGCKGNLASLSFDIGKTVLYRKDKEGEGFKRSSKTLADGYGDCEDFGMVWYDCLILLGYKPKLYACINEGGKSHAIVIFVKEGYWCFTSNELYYKTNFGPHEKEEFLKFAYPAERYEVVV